MFLLFVIATIIVLVAIQNKKSSGDQGKRNVAKQNNYPKEVSYQQRMNLYQNAIEQNRYHSITKLARDYHLPAHLIMNDLKQMQADGFLRNIKVEYNHDEIVYLDEANRKVRQKKENEQNALPVKNTHEGQNTNSTKSKAYTETKTKVQQNAGSSNSQDGQQVKNRKVTANRKRNSGKQKVEVGIRDGITVDGAQEEYQADYSLSQAEYNYIAEYPDTNHIWDDLNPELFPKNDEMRVCPKCGTHNIIVRNSQGKCNCYFCQEELI